MCTHAVVLVLTFTLLPERCTRLKWIEEAARAPEHIGARATPRANHDPVRMEILDKDVVPHMFVMRGGPRGPDRLVFLHGMCGHGLGYAQSFQFSAARWGTLIAPQADVICGNGPWASWSSKLEDLDRRIVTTFRLLGHQEPIENIIAIGYSQGASRAEELARRWPRRYTRVIWLGAPQIPLTSGLSLLSAVTMAGSRDRQDLMRAGATRLRLAGIPATYRAIPNAAHGEMGETPELTMGDALTWLFENSRVPPAIRSK